MRVSAIMRSGVFACAFSAIPLLVVSAQELPRPAQSPNSQAESSPTLRESAYANSAVPAQPAEEWSSQAATLAERRTSQNAAKTLSRPPIPIPDAYATIEGVTLDIPAPGLIANDYHPDGVGFILSNFFSPEHGSLPSIVTNGAFRYVPPDGFTGTDTFRYLLRDDNGNFSAPITVTIEVLPDPNRPPIPVPDEYATLQDTELNVAAPGLIANDVDPDGDSFILSNFFSPEHGTLPSIVTNGAFRYVPAPGFTGIDTFRYILRDEHDAFSDAQTVTIHVLPPGGDNPVAIPDHYVTTEGETLDIPAPGLIANDIDPDGDTFILSNFFSPEHGTLPSIVTNGSFRYVPAPGFVGTDTFSYSLRNDKGNFSEFVTVTIEVLPDFNRPPIPIPDFYGTPVDETLDIPAPGLIANDLDPDGDAFILSNFLSPEHGSLPSIVTNGAFRYVPPPGFTGVDTFRYILRDEHNAFSDAVTVTIFVGVDAPDTPDPCDDLLTLPSWDGTVTSNGDGTGHMVVHAPLGLARVHFYESSNLMTDLAGAGFVEDAFNDWVWDGDPGVEPEEVTIKLETIDKSDGRVNFWVRFHDTCPRVVDIDPVLDLGFDDEPLPDRFVLDQNYPNPFNPATTIRFSLPEAGHVTLEVFDVLGRQVLTLIDGLQTAGSHEVAFDAEALPSGAYVYRLEAGTFVRTRQMLLIK